MASSIASQFPTPVSCFRVRSWCHQWLSVNTKDHNKVGFSTCDDDSCRIILRPWAYGLYMLQVLPYSHGSQFSAADQQTPSNALNGVESAKTISESKFEHGRERIASVGDTWFLCRRGSVVVLATNKFDENSTFCLEFDEHGRVRFRVVHDNSYLTADSKGYLRGGTKKAKKWEHFVLVEEAISSLWTQTNMMICAPVRVTLQANTGKYMCSAMPVICARGEAPCCCEEFLLDLSFPTLIPVSKPKLIPERELNSKESSNLVIGGISGGIDGSRKLKCAISATQSSIADGSVCTIRSADCKRMLSAEPDGIVFTTSVEQVRGMENFVVKVHPRKGSRTVSIRSYKQTGKDKSCGQYLSVSGAGDVLCNKSEKKKCEEFDLGLANGSRVLIRSIHGGYLACDPSVRLSDTPYNNGFQREGSREELQRSLCSCFLRSSEDMEGLGAWQLRSHGDSLYTMVAVPLAKGSAQVYLCVDSVGRVLQSSEPAVHFPATSSLFEVVPVSGACLDTMDDEICSFTGIVGFTIRTVARIHGKRRFLSVEPTGKVTASRSSVSRWEIFHVIDVDATAAAAQHDFVCLPAAVNLNLAGSYRSIVSSTSSQQGRSISLSTAWTTLSASEALQKACGATAEIIRCGGTVPRRLTASLQDLCIGHICWLASGSGSSQQSSSTLEKPFYGIEDKMKETCCFAFTDSELCGLVSLLNSSTGQASGISASIPAEFLDESMFNIPDDLLARIWALWRSRQHPQLACKWWPSSLLSQTPAQQQIEARAPPNHGGRGFGHVPDLQRLPVVQVSMWGSTTEGWHCGSCGSGGVLAMDPSINPAHYRYLEVQLRAVSDVPRASTGSLWNAISFAGLSLMTTALVCRVVSICRVISASPGAVASGVTSSSSTVG